MNLTQTIEDLEKQARQYAQAAQTLRAIVGKSGTGTSTSKSGAKRAGKKGARKKSRVSAETRAKISAALKASHAERKKAAAK